MVEFTVPAQSEDSTSIRALKPTACLAQQELELPLGVTHLGDIADSSTELQMQSWALPASPGRADVFDYSISTVYLQCKTRKLIQYKKSRSSSNS